MTGGTARRTDSAIAAEERIARAQAWPRSGRRGTDVEGRSRRAVALIAALLVLGVLLSSLSGARAVAEPSGTVQGFSTLRVGSLGEPDSLNPFVGVLDGSYVIWAHVYELLVGIGPDLTPIPALAQYWSVDATETVWTFHLQDNVTWHDGVAFTSEDVNFTFRYIYPATPENPIGCNLPLLQSYLGDYSRRIGVDVGNISTPDPSTVVIPTYQPKANILSMFIPILPKHVWSSIACNQATHVTNIPPIGTGMYKFTAWVRGAYIQLDLNTAYWRLSPPEDYVDRILITYYYDAASLYNAFVVGAVDATDSLPADKFALLPDTVAGGSSPNVVKFAVDALGFAEVGACVASDVLIDMYGAHGGRNWLVTNRTVRQALNYAADRANLVRNVLSGYGTPGSTLIPPATPFWHYNATAAENYTFDLDRARSILNDPIADGMTLKVGYTTPGDYGQNLDPAAANNQDAFIDTNGDTIRDVVNASQVVAGDDWGASAPNSMELSFEILVRNYDTAGQNAAARLENWWDQVGIHVATTIVSESQLIAQTYACSEDLYWWGWGVDVDPDFALSVMTTSEILNWQDAWYSNFTYDAWYLAQQSQVDPDVRQQTIWDMQKLLYFDAPYLIAWYDQILTAIRSDLFTGFGDWVAHPGLGLTGYGNDLVMLTMRAASGGTNECPTTPVIEGTPPRYVFVNATTVFMADATDPENDPMTWTFSWDDAAGSTTTVDTAAGVTQASAGFAWNQTGFYNVTVSVTDNLCGSSATSAPFQVVALPEPMPPGWLVGTVRDATDPLHAPIAGAVVFATMVGSPQQYTTSTDASGRYNMTLPSGDYNVTASADGYYNGTLSNLTVLSRQETRADFGLVQINSAPAAAFVVAPLIGNLSTSFDFDASGSSDRQDPLANLSFRWDWEDDGVWDTVWSGSPAASHQYALAGTLTIRLEVLDSGGLASNTTHSVLVDGAPPASHAVLTGQRTGDWWSSEVLVALEATDEASGVASIWYHVDAAAWALYAAPFSVSAEGTHTIVYNSTDVAGNVEPSNTETINIDLTGPTTTATVTGTAGSNGWYTSAVSVSLTTADDLSGPGSVRYRVDGGAWMPYSAAFSIGTEGIHTLEYNGTDAAGNAEAVKSATIRIDTGAPTTTATLVGTQSGTWYTTSVTATLIASDSASGVASIVWRLDGGSWQSYVSPVVIAVAGSHLLEWRATDAAGNTETVGSVTVRLDLDPPTVSSSVSGTEGASGWFRSTVNVSAAATDAASGVAVIEYRLEGGAWTPYIAPVTLSDGVHMLDFRATDVAGFVSELESLTVRVDTAAPSLVITGPQGTVTTSGVTIAWEGSDPTSGLDHYEVSVDGGSFESVGTNSTVTVALADGVHSVRVTAVDRAGNSVNATASFAVDTGLFSVNGPYGAWPLVTVVVAVVAASLVLVLLWRRRHRT